ncbi:unnamed protein product, partial [Nesidiocoris tenuis]
MLLPPRAELTTLELWRSIISECLASFFYVFTVCGAAAGVASGGSTAQTVLASAFASGFSIAALTQSFGHISDNQGLNTNFLTSVYYGISAYPSETLRWQTVANECRRFSSEKMGYPSDNYKSHCVSSTIVLTVPSTSHLSFLSRSLVPQQHQQISDVSRSSPPPSETVEAADVPGRTVIRFQVLDEQTSSRSIFLMPGLPRKLYVFLSSSRYLANVRWGQSLYHLRAGLAPEGYCDTPSGAHVNPAISIAMMITRNITVLRGLMFVIAQCGGGIAGAALLYG